MPQVSRRSGAEVVIQVDGTFDAVAAWDLRKRLRAMPPEARVTLDFTRVREFLDLGVAVIAPSLLEREHPRVTLRGLRQHQHRMFRYFGIDVGVAQAAAGAENRDTIDA
jgi:hypothetical protein